MVHGDGTRADGRRSSHHAHISEIVGRETEQAREHFGNTKSNVVCVQAGYLARPTPEAPETQIYFINHRSGAFPVLRLRTVVRGERASRSIVNRTTALWSIWVVASLILADSRSGLVFIQMHGRGFVVSRGSNGAPNIDEYVFIRPRWTPPPTNERKRT